MSDAELDERICEGVSRALAHGIRTEQGACTFVGLQFVLGRDFDRDPQLPWVREILDGSRVHRGLSTVDLLLREVLLREAAARDDDDVRRVV
ncbi:MAG: hypothetical protein AB1Z98_12775 [Nannocystaceae bacterium]